MYKLSILCYNKYNKKTSYKESYKALVVIMSSNKLVN